MRRLAKVLLPLSVLTLPGCFTLGPTTKERTTFIRMTDEVGNPVKIGVVRDNIKTTVQIVRQDGSVGEAILDIGGWSVIPPKENK